MMYLVGKLLHKPLQKLSGGIGIDPTSAVAFTGTLVTNATTFGMMDRMNKKGVALNAAFAVSASFVFGDHLAFTMAYDARYLQFQDVLQQLLQMYFSQFPVHRIKE